MGIGVASILDSKESRTCEMMMMMIVGLQLGKRGACLTLEHGDHISKETQHD